MELISVIIPTYNRKQFLENAIRSVRDQTYKNIEIIVVDDGSKDNYAEPICKQFKNCNYYRKNNGGLSSTRNFGIEKAKGEYIAFLDDDDLWKLDKIETQINIFNKYPNIDLVHSSAEVIDVNGELTGDVIGASKHKAYKRSGYVFWNALGTWVVKSPTPLIRTKVFSNNFRFDELIKVGEDLDFYWRLFFNHKVYYLQEPTAYYRVYNSTNRLSEQKDRYIGLELKIYNNLIKMPIKNPITRHKIAYVLLKSIYNKFKKSNMVKDFNLNILEMLIWPKTHLEKLTNYIKTL